MCKILQRSALVTAILAIAWACGDGVNGPEPTPLAVSAAIVDPVFVPGNPSCSDLGYDFGFKPQPEPPPTGVYAFPDGLNSVTITSDGTFFDWTSTLGIDAVIVKGGANANVYAYDPEAFSDTGLSSPINPNTSRPFAISHIEFCYDYEVEISKNANTSFTRAYEWNISKTAPVTELTLSAGQTHTVSYAITVDIAGYTDSDWAVEGTITISNNTPFEATIESVSDVVSPSIVVATDCGVPLPHVLPAGATLECVYSAPLPDGSSRINNATVTTSGLVGGGEATAAVSFTDPTTEVNSCVNVTDDQLGVLGEVCVNDAPTTFSIGKDFRYEECGTFTFTNVATIDETGHSDNHTITIEVVGCDVDQGCTLTPGYWKTHSSYGPVPEKKWDDTWNLLASGPDTPFFLSGKSYYEMLWTSPRGDGYIILARAFIAAQLNLLNGASMPSEVHTAYDAAMDFLTTYDYTAKGAVKGKSKGQLTEWSEILDDYNNGLVGPGHCDDDTDNG
jgi:hypothetical protein